MQYYAELASGKVIPIDSVSFETLLVDHGWKQKLHQPGLAIVWKPKWKSRLKSLQNSGTPGSTTQVLTQR
jgi:hypothetical protein